MPACCQHFKLRVCLWRVQGEGHYLVTQSLDSETGATVNNIPLINIKDNAADADNDNEDKPAKNKKRGHGKSDGSSVKKKHGSVERTRKTTLEEQQENKYDL